jgi:hypothetical protein
MYRYYTTKRPAFYVINVAGNIVHGVADQDPDPDLGLNK